MPRSGKASRTSSSCSNGNPVVTQVTAAAPLILTASDRLARQLREDHSLSRRREGARVWEAPRIASFSRWLSDTWTSTWPDAQLLSATQELVLWQDAVERDEAGRRLLSPMAAAREARRTDQLLRQHAIDLDRAPAWQEEHQAFRRWRQAVARRMAQSGWITAADLPDAVVDLVGRGAVRVPQRVELRGFPAVLARGERRVIEALAAQGAQVDRPERLQSRGELRHLAFEDDESQFRFVAAELRERLRACADHAAPPPRILVALPDPEARRGLIESVFRDLLAPWAARGEGLLPWRWERGTSLADHPWVADLLAILQVAEERNAPALLSRVLLSAALWTPAQLRQTAAADLALRRCGFPRLRLARVGEALSGDLRGRFERLRAVIQDAPRRALPSQWAVQFRLRLQALGWPGAGALDSAAYQATQSAAQLLDRLATLDAQLSRVPESTAREWLGEFARAGSFVPRVEHGQPILIASYEEAAPLQADLVYLLDASAAQWPRPARTTPFVAIETLRAAGVVEALPELALERARELSAALLGTAPEVCIAHARVDARGGEVRPSPLLGAGVPWTPTTIPSCVGALESALAAGSVLQAVAADPVPPVDADERAGLRANAGLFKDWFESPFFAFCRFRLGIESLPEPPQGLDARAQGILIHALLAEFWSGVPDRAALLCLPASEPMALRARLEPLIEPLLIAHLPEREVGAAIVRLERERVLDLCCQWLQHEAGRVDDFRVEHREVAVEPVVAGLQLRLRLDRIDRVQSPDGARWLVIDYKTGAEAHPRGWNADRLREPQLPLYASHAAVLAAGVPGIDGLCFGHVKDGHPALVALTNWRKLLREPEPGKFEQHWAQRLEAWRAAIEVAARGFLAGEAGLDPRIGDRSHNADLLVLGGRVPDDALDPAG